MKNNRYLYLNPTDLFDEINEKQWIFDYSFPFLICRDSTPKTCLAMFTFAKH